MDQQQDREPPDFEALAARFDGAGVAAIALMGSFARGDAAKHSDVDLVRFSGRDGAIEGDGSYLLDGRLVVVSTLGPAAVESAFARPELAIHQIPGFRAARALLDRGSCFAAIQRRARDFTWDEEMQLRANAWAGDEMVGLIEEVHKGLQGLASGGTGRLLNARFGLSWGLSRVFQVQRAVFITSDNTFFDEVAEAVGSESVWVRLRRKAFAVEEENTGAVPRLREQVLAGLRLYVETYRLLRETLTPSAKPLVEETVRLIEAEIAGHPSP